MILIYSYDVTMHRFGGFGIRIISKMKYFTAQVVCTCKSGSNKNCDVFNYTKF